MLSARERYATRITAYHNHMLEILSKQDDLVRATNTITILSYEIEKAEFLNGIDPYGKFLGNVNEQLMTDAQRVQFERLTAHYERASRICELIDMLATNEGKVQAIRSAAWSRLLPPMLYLYVQMNYPNDGSLQTDAMRKRAKDARRRGDLGVAVNMYEQLGMFFTASVFAEAQGNNLKAQCYGNLHDLIKEAQVRHWKIQAMIQRQR